MFKLIKPILDWSEVWALVIPLFILAIRPKQPVYFRPVIIYLWLSLFLDILIDIGYVYRGHVPHWLNPNNYLYNVLSIVRFICFSSFFILLRQPFLVTLKKILPVLSLAFLLINFIFFEDFFNPITFSSRLFATEAGLLLFYCLQYYLYNIQEEKISAQRQPEFWVVTGLSIYVIFNFLYFLFYTSLIANHVDFVVFMWNFHNISFIILCIFIGKGLISAKKSSYN